MVESAIVEMPGIRDPWQHRRATARSRALTTRWNTVAQETG